MFNAKEYKRIWMKNYRYRKSRPNILKKLSMYRKIVKLRERSFSWEEIARRTGIKRETARTWFHKRRKFLKSES